MLTRLFYSLLIIVFSLVPTWIFLAARSLLNPQGFWQNFVVAGFGVWVLGAMQIVLGIVGLLMLAGLWPSCRRS